MKFTLGDHLDMRADLDNLQQTYERLGVDVVRLPSLTTDAVFHRDVSAWTPNGLIKANMMKQTRRWEPNEWLNQLGLTRADVGVRKNTPRLFGHARFEGADLHFMSPTRALLAYGARTTHQAAKAIADWLLEWDVKVTGFELPYKHPQHLLGCVNTINDRIFETSYFGVSICAGAIPLPASTYKSKGTNWVQVGGAIVVSDAIDDETFEILERHARVITVPIPSLLAHGGGVACATGILEYDFQPTRV
jgi:N-dimethylarginine dimethylaminohydrolase